MPENDMEIDKIELQQNNYQWQLSCINSADTKAGFLITVNLALIGFTASQVNKILEKPFLSNHISKWPIIFLLCLAITTLISLFFAAKAIWPRLSSGSTSIFYFKSILNKDIEQYSKEIEYLEPQSILNDLSGQVWELSKIALKKYKNVRTGFWAYGISILFLVTLYVYKALNG
jgi:hypothetical protein